MRGIKKSNEYAKLVPNYADIPKSVFAAIAFSMCFIAVEENPTAANERFYEEWEALYNAGIVPQKPIKGRSNGS
jgi:hypothetical protein